MGYEFSMRDDGILRMTHIGDIKDEDVEPYVEEAMPFLEAATEAEPLHFLVDNSRMGKVCAKYRQRSLELFRDPRGGKSAVFGANRYARVLASFMIKASGLDNIRFFDSEEEALAWLKAES